MAKVDRGWHVEPTLPVLAAMVALVLAGPSIEWNAPEGCPSRDEVIHHATALGADLENEPLDMRGAISGVAGEYRLELEVGTRSGTTRRTLRAPTCESLGRATALILAVALDPFTVPSEAVVPPPPEPAAEPAPPLSSDAMVEPVPTPASRPDATPSRPPIRGAAIVSGTIGRSIGPSVEGRAGLGLALDAPWVRAELLATHTFETTTRSGDRPEIGARVHAWGGSARVGPWFEVGPVELALPLGVGLHAVVGRGFGTPITRRRRDVSWGFVAAPGVRVPLGRWVAVGADVEIEVAIRRPAFAVEDLGTLHRIPRIGARGGIRVEIRFPGVDPDQPGPRRRLR